MANSASPKRIISIVNQKGGVGKTTTAVNLATAMAAIGKKVLILDLDPQGNASTGFGIPNDERKLTTYDLLVGDIKIEDAAVRTIIPNLDIVSSTIDLSGAELELVPMMRREYRLKNCVDISTMDYDAILIDCPPSLGLLTINALTASNCVLIPLQCEFYALEGLSHLLKTIDLIKRNLNPDLSIHGVVLTMYDRRNKLTEQIEEDVRAHLGTQVYKTVIPRNVRVSEAPSHGKPAIVYDMHCTGSQAYLQLAREVLKREKKLIEALQNAA
jgi:chromosome partitioning protein